MLLRTCLMLSPLNSFDINAILNHLPQRRHFTKTVYLKKYVLNKLAIDL